MKTCKMFLSKFQVWQTKPVQKLNSLMSDEWRGRVSNRLTWKWASLKGIDKIIYLKLNIKGWRNEVENNFVRSKKKSQELYVIRASIQWKRPYSFQLTGLFATIWVIPIVRNCLLSQVDLGPLVHLTRGSHTSHLGSLNSVVAGMQTTGNEPL